MGSPPPEARFVVALVAPLVRDPGDAQEAFVEDRRHEPRQPVAWLVRLWLNEHSFVSGRVVEASTQGAWLYLHWLPAGLLRPDGIYRIDVLHPETGKALMCAAEIRHINQKGAGVRLRQGVFPRI